MKRAALILAVLALAILPGAAAAQTTCFSNDIGRSTYTNCYGVGGSSYEYRYDYGSYSYSYRYEVPSPSLASPIEIPSSSRSRSWDDFDLFR